jgi:hypothetical protein
MKFPGAGHPAKARPRLRPDDQVQPVRWYQLPQTVEDLDLVSPVWNEPVTAVEDDQDPLPPAFDRPNR